MNLALDGLSFISKAIEDTQKRRITHIAVRDESTDTIVTIEPSIYVPDTLEFSFITPGNPDTTFEELVNAPAPF